MKLVYIPRQIRKECEMKTWNRFYKSIQAVKSDKAKRLTK